MLLIPLVGLQRVSAVFGEVVHVSFLITYKALFLGVLYPSRIDQLLEIVIGLIDLDSTDFIVGFDYLWQFQRHFTALAARKAGHGNDGVWKAIKSRRPTLPTLFGNPFGIPTFPRPRRLDYVLSCPPQFEASRLQGGRNGCLSSTA
jgi:hypothetical protein